MMSEPGTCKDCRWWSDEHLAEHERYANVKPCTNPKVMFADVHDGNRLSVATGKLGDPCHVIDGDEVAVEDGSGYYAAMLPGPDFGCVHFEAKP